MSAAVNAALHIRTDELLTKFGCTPESPVSLFWDAFAAARPTAAAEMQTVCDHIAARLADFCVDTVQEMPVMMTELQLEQVMAQAGGKATWSGLVTYMLGPFKASVVMTVPLNLVSVPETAGSVKSDATYQILPLGATMEAEGTLEADILPEYVFNAYTECEDPLNQELSAEDVTATLNAYTHFMITVHKQPAADKPMRKWHSKQLKTRLRHLPDHGRTPGPIRRWFNLLTERKRNVARKGGTVSANIRSGVAPTIAQAPIDPKPAWLWEQVCPHTEICVTRVLHRASRA